MTRTPGRRATVLVLTSIFHLGGAERITHQVARRLTEAGFSFLFCSIYERGPTGEAFVQDGFTLYERLVRSKWDPRVAWRLRKIIDQHQVDLVFLISQPLTLFWGSVLRFLSGTPLVAAVHNTFTSRRSLKGKVSRWLLARADRVVAVASMQKNHLVEEEGIPAERITVIYNGIDADEMAVSENPLEVKRRLSLKPEGQVVGVVGRLVHLKGIDVFLRAAQRIARRLPAVEFVIVGDGPARDSLEALAKQIGLADRVHFLGFRQDVAEIIRTFDVAVLSSRTEAFPLVILEYMSMAKPVVASRVGSVPELVLDGSTGALIEAGDERSLAGQVLTLLENPALAREYGRQGRKLAKEQFSLLQTADQTAALFTELLNSRTASRLAS